MTSWETCDANADEQYRRDFVLKRPSTVGPWVVLGLGIALIAFLGCLVSVNLLLPPPPPLLAPGSAGRAEVTSTARRSGSRSALKHPPEWRRPAFNLLPQGRTPNVLFGGQGPALLPEHILPPEPGVSTQASAEQ